VHAGGLRGSTPAAAAAASSAAATTTSSSSAATAYSGLEFRVLSLRV